MAMFEMVRMARPRTSMTSIQRKITTTSSETHAELLATSSGCLTHYHTNQNLGMEAIVENKHEEVFGRRPASKNVLLPEIWHEIEGGKRAGNITDTRVEEQNRIESLNTSYKKEYRSSLSITNLVFNPALQTKSSLQQYYCISTL
jgi:hypothetical protein